MLFSKPRVLILLRAKSLFLFLKGEGNPVLFDFPLEAIRHQEVIDPDRFQKSFSEFIKNLQLEKQDALILLSPEIVYSKTVVKQTQADSEDETRQFEETLPFHKESVSKMTVEDGERVIIFATNRHLFEQIILVLSDYEWKVKAVSPLELLGEFNVAEPGSDFIDKVLKEGQLINDSNFLDNKSFSNSEKVRTSSGAGVSVKDKVLLGFLLIFIIAFSGLSYMAVKSGIVKNPFEKAAERSMPESITASPTAEAVAESTPSAEASVSGTLKEELKLQILNGTGRAGQAKNMQDNLSTLGYKNFELGNAEATSSSEVTYRTQVNPDTRREINLVLTNTLGEFTEYEASAAADFDVSILLGR